MYDHIHPAFRDALSSIDRQTDEMWQRRDELIREEDLTRALQECHDKGVSEEHMKTLLRETGALWWGPRKD